MIKAMEDGWMEDLENANSAGLSLMARGFWAGCNVLMRMPKLSVDRNGELKGSVGWFARLGRCHGVEAGNALRELERSGTAEVWVDVARLGAVSGWSGHGVVTVVNRRMRREWEVAENARVRQTKHRGAAVVRHSCHGDVTRQGAVAHGAENGAIVLEKASGGSRVGGKGVLKVSRSPTEKLLKPFQLEELKLKLEGAEAEFCAGAKQLVTERDWEDGRPEHFQGDGSKWRARWRHGASRPTCVRVMLDLIERGKAGGGAADWCWQEFGGKDLDKKRLEGGQ